MGTEAEQALVADLRAAGVYTVRLPFDDEWTRLAGGAANDRYPWDSDARAIDASDADAMTARANVRESKIGQTSPVAQYPQGSSVPFGLMDLAGNVWEWTQIRRDDGAYWLRGGSWDYNAFSARVSSPTGTSLAARTTTAGFGSPPPLVLVSDCWMLGSESGGSGGVPPISFYE